MPAATTFAFSIDLPIRSDWANVDLLRTSVQNCFKDVFSDIDGCQALSMVTGELLEIAAERDDLLGDGHPSRLGLVRIAYEGSCTLHAEVMGNVVRVTADSVF
jgi:hypothetical protein